jgi:hypothetical protein
LAVAEHVGEVADQGTGGGEFGAPVGDRGEGGAVGVGEFAGRGEDPGGDLLGLGCGRWRGGGGVAAELGGEAAQGAQAALVAAGAQFLVQLLGAAHSLVPSLAQVGLVRAEQAGPGQPGAGDELVWGGGGGVAADGFAVQL